MSSKLHRGEKIRVEALPWLPTSSGVPSQAPSYPVSSGIPASGAPDSRIQAAYQEGLREGQASGQQQMAAQLQAMEGRLARSIEELTGLRARFRHEAEEDVVELALAIARRILHRELTVAPDALLGLVKAALEKIEAREVHRVRVEPRRCAAGAEILRRDGATQASGSDRRPESAARRRYSGLHARPAGRFRRDAARGD